MKDKEVNKMEICGHTVRLGDNLRVLYAEALDGCIIEGEVLELRTTPLQVRLSCGWCFHGEDEILAHNDWSNQEEK